MVLEKGLSGTKLLLIEDNKIFRKTFKEGLQNFFPATEIEEAADGTEALNKVEDFKPELIFMDIQLPGENGLQLTRKIKAQHPEIKIIILTTYDSPEYREAALKSQADSFIAKDSLNWEQLKNLL